MDYIEEVIRSQDKLARQAAAEPERGAAALARIADALVELDAAAWAVASAADVTVYMRRLSHMIIGVLASKSIVRDALIAAKGNAAWRARAGRA